MYKLVTCLFILRLHTTLTQFPDHIDLQKVGEVIFNNDKYNILKPTTHIVTDYFKEFMLRRQSKEFPTKRVFIDDNGFRHSWSGFGEDNKSLRKTEVDIGEKSEDFNEAVDIMPSQNPNEGVENTELAENTTDESLTMSQDDTNTEVSEDIVTFRATPRRKTTTPHWSYFQPKLPKVAEPLLREAKNDNKAKKTTATKMVSKQDGNKAGARTVARTTFFCPFFGVMTMSAFID